MRPIFDTLIKKRGICANHGEILKVWIGSFIAAIIPEGVAEGWSCLIVSIEEAETINCAPDQSTQVILLFTIACDEDKLFIGAVNAQVFWYVGISKDVETSQTSLYVEVGQSHWVIMIPKSTRILLIGIAVYFIVVEWSSISSDYLEKRRCQFFFPWLLERVKVTLFWLRKIADSILLSVWIISMPWKWVSVKDWSHLASVDVRRDGPGLFGNSKSWTSCMRMCSGVIEGHGGMGFRLKVAISFVWLEELIHARLQHLTLRNPDIWVEVIDPDYVDGLSCNNIKHGSVGAAINCLRTILVKLSQSTAVLSYYLLFHNFGLSSHDIGSSF